MGSAWLLFFFFCKSILHDHITSTSPIQSLLPPPPPLYRHTLISPVIFAQIKASDCFAPILAGLSPDSARLSRSSMLANDGKGIVLCNSPQPGSGAGLLCQTIPVCWCVITWCVITICWTLSGLWDKGLWLRFGVSMALCSASHCRVTPRPRLSPTQLSC